MEQTTGASIPPIPPAGVDPAYIPGLTPPARPVAAPGDTASALKKAAPAAPDDAPDDADEPAAAEEPEAAEPEAEADDSEAADEADESDEGPLFKVSDRRGSITADRHGITFTLDSETAEFGWDEIGAVEIDTPRFGRRFSVTVYTSSRRWFDTDVEAPSKALLKTWAADLDAVLDAHFEDASEDAAEDASEEADTTEDPDDSEA